MGCCPPPPVAAPWWRRMGHPPTQRGSGKRNAEGTAAKNGEQLLLPAENIRRGGRRRVGCGHTSGGGWGFGDAFSSSTAASCGSRVKESNNSSGAEYWVE
jgi:hypothetical protein